MSVWQGRSNWLGGISLHLILWCLQKLENVSGRIFAGNWELCKPTLVIKLQSINYTKPQENLFLFLILCKISWSGIPWIGILYCSIVLNVRPRRKKWLTSSQQFWPDWPHNWLEMWISFFSRHLFLTWSQEVYWILRQVHRIAGIEVFQAECNFVNRNGSIFIWNPIVNGALRRSANCLLMFLLVLLAVQIKSPFVIHTWTEYGFCCGKLLKDWQTESHAKIFKTVSLSNQVYWWCSSSRCAHYWLLW